MLSRNFYLIVHIIGIAMMFTALGGVAVHAANGGTKGASRTRTLVAVIHGLAAVLILVGGFGMLARLGFMANGALPRWVIAKIIIWVLLSGVILLPYRRVSLAKPFFISMPLLAGLAAWFALYKPTL